MLLQYACLTTRYVIFCSYIVFIFVGNLRVKGQAFVIEARVSVWV